MIRFVLVIFYVLGIIVYSFAQTLTKPGTLCIEPDDVGRVRGHWYLLKDERIVKHGAVRDTCTRLNVPASGSYVLSVLLQGRLARRTPFMADTLHADYVFWLRNEHWVNQLGEVVVRGGSRFSQQGDTLTIRTDDVETRPFGDATELFDNIPGLQVRSNGSVWIMGKPVSQIDVDGRALFGGDPSATLTMLRADMIAALKVTELPATNGKGKLVVSVQLKKDRKNGQYGELGGGLGTLTRYDLASRYNRLLPGTAINGFLTANSINRRGLSWSDFSRLLNTDRGHQLTGASSPIQAMTQHGTTALSDYDGPSALDFVGDAPGISQVLSGGINASTTTKTGDLLGYVLASRHNRTLDQQRLAVTYLPPFQQTTNERGQQELLPFQLIGSLKGKWRRGQSGLLAIRNTLYIHQDTQLQRNRQQISLLPEASETTLNETYQTQRSGLNNHFQIAWSERGKRGGSNTSIYVHHQLNKQQHDDDNRVDRAISPTSYEALRNQHTQGQLAGLEVIKSSPVSKRWLVEGRALVQYQQYEATTTARFQNQPEVPTASTNGQFDLSDWLTQTNVHALYRHKKLTLTGGVAAWQWRSQRQFEGQALALVEKRLLPTAVMVYNQTSRTKYVLRLGSDVDRPTLGQLNPVVDSSRLQSISAGQLNLGGAPRQFVQLDASTDQLIRNVGLNLNLMISNTDFPVLTDFRTLGLGLTRTSPAQLALASQDVTANLTLARVTMQSPVQWFMVNTYLQRDSYQLVNKQVNVTSLQLLTHSQTLNWTVRQGVKLNLLWNSIAISVNRQRLNWQHKVTLRSDLKLASRFYADLNVNYWLNNSLGQQTRFLQMNLQADLYLLKNKGLRFTARTLNLLDQRSQINTGQSSNGIVVTEQSVLPRTLMLAVTFFPEKWL
jgi:hypothetical protein